MEDFEEIRSWVAGYARREPGPDYCERFLREFRERQRQEAMSVPVRRLMWERTGTWLASRGVRHGFRWGMGAGGLALLGMMFLWWGREEPAGAGEGEAAVAESPSQVLGGFLGSAMEPGMVGLMEPALVQIGWGGGGSGRWTPGFEVADGMFVSAWPEARLQEPVQVRVLDRSGMARIVLKDPRSGLVVIDARDWKMKPGMEARVGR